MRSSRLERLQLSPQNTEAGLPQFGIAMSSTRIRRVSASLTIGGGFCWEESR